MFLIFFLIAIIIIVIAVMGGLKDFQLLFIGVLLGVVYLMFFKKPKQIILEEKNNIVEDVKQDPIVKENQIIDKDTIDLGLQDIDNNKFLVTDKELNAMCFLLGASGSGKTTTIGTILEMPIKNNYPVLYVDGKGSPSAWKAVESMCKKHGRNFKLFDTTTISNSCCYNPLSHGGFTELKDKIISLFNWTEEHYKLQADRFLQGLFKFIKTPEVKELLKYESLDMKILSKCLSIDTINSLCDAVGEEKAKDMRLILNDTGENSINGLMNRIQSIAESEIGELFDSKSTQLIDLLESIKNNDVIFFSLNSLKFAEFAQMLGRLVIADIKTVASNFYDDNKKIYCIFDEFNVFASEIVVNLINKSREYGFRNIISTQEASDLIIDGQRKLLDQVWGNTNVKIAMRQEVPESQDMLSKSISTQEVYKVSINDNFDSEGLGQKESKTGYTSTLEDEFIYKPKVFGQLKTGEAIVFIKHPEFRHSKVKIRRVENV